MKSAVSQNVSHTGLSGGGSTPQGKILNMTPLVLIVVGLLFSLTVFGGAFVYRFLENTMATLPKPEEVAHIKPRLVTKIYAADSTVVHEFSIERRFWKPLDSISPYVSQALIATEDRRFYTHWGIDPKRIITAAVGNVVSGGYSQGGSTLTQQLARNLYFTHKKTIMRKVREILTAIQLETYYSKEEILELYLNMVYLGGGTYGVEAASLKYFSKSASDLNVNEAAVLAGLIQRPEAYRPDRSKNLERIKKRRSTVLISLVRAGDITQDEAHRIAQTEIPANPYKKSDDKAPYFIEHVRQHLERTYGSDELYNGGLQVYTTLNIEAQDSLEIAVTNHLDSLQEQPNRMFLQQDRTWKKIGVSYDSMMQNFDSLYAAYYSELFKDLPDSLKRRRLEVSAVALDVHSGAVRVLAGGRNYKISKYNRAIQSVRQPGSAMKPFVYAAAIEEGYSPSSVMIDKPITLMTDDGPWRPENYSHKFYGPITLRDALRRSVNLIAIQKLRAIGAQKVIDFSRRVGLTHNLPNVPALAIGAAEVTNMELTAGYAAFANGGNLVKPYFVEKVVDKNGRILEQHDPFKERVMDVAIANTMASMMSDVINRGTGVEVRREGFRRPAAGKTGTTNNYSDAWFVAYTPQISMGVWVGADQRRSMGYGMTGARGGIPIWVGAMKPLHAELPVETFSLEGLEKKELCSTSNLLATSYCPKTYKDIFVIGREIESCDEHGPGARRSSDDVINYFGSESNTEGKSMPSPSDTTEEESDDDQLLF